MLIEIIKGLSVPFIGTTLGAFCVFFCSGSNGSSINMEFAASGN